MTSEQRFAKDSEGVREAREVYRRLMTAELERENYDRYIVFDFQTDDFEIGDDFLETALTLKARRPNSRLSGFQIGDGGRAIDRFGSPRFASEQ